MKLMVVLLSESDASRAEAMLADQGFQPVQVPSSGGFLRQGNVTLMIGMEADRVDPAIAILRQACADPAQPGQRRATVLVLPVEGSEHV